MDIVTTLFYAAVAGALLWGAYAMFISPKADGKKKAHPDAHCDGAGYGPLGPADGSGDGGGGGGGDGS